MNTTITRTEIRFLQSIAEKATDLEAFRARMSRTDVTDTEGLASTAQKLASIATALHALTEAAEFSRLFARVGGRIREAVLSGSPAVNLLIESSELTVVEED